MSKYVFCVLPEDDGEVTYVYLSLKENFLIHRGPDFHYSDEDYEELYKIFRPLGIAEETESMYYSPKSPEETRSILDAHPLFEFSQELEDYINTHW